MSRQITVFFLNNHAVTFDRDRVSFSGDGVFFDFEEKERPDELKKYSALVTDGRVLVNWDNVGKPGERPAGRRLKGRITVAWYWWVLITLLVIWIVKTS